MNSGKKITYNVVLGVVSQIITIIFGIFIPRMILVRYGSEINGLVNSITQIYTYIALLEAGVGTATIQALYKTLGNRDVNGTNAVLAATNRYYHRTGILYLLAILIFAIIYPIVVVTDIPRLTVIVVILFNGLGNVLTFFFQGKYFLLLQADGQNYVQTSLNIITNILKNILKIWLLYLGLEIIWVQSVALLISIIQMIYMAIYIQRNCSWIDLKVKPDYKSISQSKNVIVHQIANLVFNNTDTILLTLFCGLKIVSVYSMYTLLFGMISTAISTITTSIVFVLGQTYHTNKDRFLKLYDIYELYNLALIFALYSVANYFILPFMKLYTSGVSDIDYIDKWLPLLFITTYLLSYGRYSATNAINIAGHFKATQSRAIIETVINLCVSIICVQYFGIYGVLLGTIAALIYRTNDMIIWVGKKIIHKSLWITYRRWIVNILLFALILGINRLLRFNLDSYIKIVLICIPYMLTVFVLYFGINSVLEKNTAKYLFKIIRVKIQRKDKR